MSCAKTGSWWSSWQVTACKLLLKWCRHWGLTLAISCCCDSDALFSKTSFILEELLSSHLEDHNMIGFWGGEDCSWLWSSGHYLSPAATHTHTHTHSANNKRCNSSLTAVCSWQKMWGWRGHSYPVGDCILATRLRFSILGLIPLPIRTDIWQIKVIPQK